MAFWPAPKALTSFSWWQTDRNCGCLTVPGPRRTSLLPREEAGTWGVDCWMPRGGQQTLPPPPRPPSYERGQNPRSAPTAAGRQGRCRSVPSQFSSCSELEVWECAMGLGAGWGFPCQGLAGAGGGGTAEGAGGRPLHSTRQWQWKTGFATFATFPKWQSQFISFWGAGENQEMAGQNKQMGWSRGFISCPYRRCEKRHQLGAPSTLNPTVARQGGETHKTFSPSG